MLCVHRGKRREVGERGEWQGEWQYPSILPPIEMERATFPLEVPIQHAKSIEFNYFIPIIEVFESCNFQQYQMRRNKDQSHLYSKVIMFYLHFIAIVVSLALIFQLLVGSLEMDKIAWT